MHLTFRSYFLTFKHPFGISKLTRKGTDSVLIELQQNGIIGHGEAVLPPYLKETKEELLSLLESIQISDFKNFTLDEVDVLLDLLPSTIEKNPAFFAAIDMALHDLLSKTTQKSIRELYDLPRNHRPLSSYTIAFSQTDEIKTKLQDALNFSLIKLKLGGNNDVNTITEVRRLSRLPISTDLNQAWDSVDPNLLNLLEQENCEYLEEPFKNNRELKTINTSIPIIADESFQGLSSFDQLPIEFKGINIKLMKCGGLREAFKIITLARMKNLKILLGCMSGSSCAVSAMSHFAPLADWIDLDGPALISNDPYFGLSYKDGEIVLKRNNGLGVDLN